MTRQAVTEIRRVLNDVGRLPVDAEALDDQADLYVAGMTSHASVNVMLELEEAFGIEFPPDMLTRSTFGSIAAIADAVQAPRQQAA
jgi:acyl carrier protein